MEYYLYSKSRGILVKKDPNRWGNYGIYWFGIGEKIVWEFSKELAKIFDSLEEAERARNFWAKHGNLYKAEADQAAEGPIPDVRVRIVGTNTDLPLPEEA